MKTVSEDKSIGARTRGAIQRGETGDKVPGFDPAAALWKRTPRQAAVPSLLASPSRSPRRLMTATLPAMHPACGRGRPKETRKPQEEKPH